MFSNEDGEFVNFELNVVLNSILRDRFERKTRKIEYSENFTTSKVKFELYLGV